MKKLLLFLSALLAGVVLYGQAKKPTIMVVPSDNWCVQRGFTEVYHNRAKMIQVPNYRTALQNDSDLLLAISKINEMMAERGFPLKNLESVLKSLENQAAEDELLTSRNLQ